MDYQTALAEFSALLQVGASALGNIASERSPELEIYLGELADIATRLREIADGIAQIADGTKS